MNVRLLTAAVLKAGFVHIAKTFFAATQSTIAKNDTGFAKEKTHSTQPVLAEAISVLLASLKGLGKSTPWQDQNFIGSSHNSE